MSSSSSTADTSQEEAITKIINLDVIMKALEDQTNKVEPTDNGELMSS